MTLLPFSPLKQTHVDFFRTMGCRVASDTRGIVAEADDGSVAGMVVLENWSATSVFGHIQIENIRCTKLLVEGVMDFVFNVCGMLYFLGILPSDNEKAMRLEKKLGFKEVYRLPNGLDHGVDAIYMCLAREEAAYLPLKEEAA